MAPISCLIFLGSILLVGSKSSVNGELVTESQPKALIDGSSIFEMMSRALLLDADAYLRGPEIIRGAGYPVEVHRIHTEDGYTLELHRIPYGRDQTPRPRPPILLVHSMMLSGTSWITNQNNSAGFILADAGYDVWIIQHRGTRYSLKHDKYLSSQPEFWNFTYEAYGKYDLPACVDYITKTSGYSQIYMMSHVWSSMKILIALSTRPELNDKIKLWVPLSPAVNLVKNDGFFSSLVKLHNLDHFINSLYYVLDGEIPFKSPFVTFVIRLLELFRVRPLVYVSRITLGIEPMDIVRMVETFVIAHHDAPIENMDRYPVMLSHVLDGIGVKPFAHMVQLFSRDAFAPFDYGTRENMEVYGKPYPDEYPLERVTAPILAVWARNDAIFTRPVLDDFERRLPNLRSYKLFPAPNPEWFHGADMLSTKSREDLYLPLVQQIKTYE